MSNQISKLERLLKDKLSKSFNNKTVSYQGGSFSTLDFKSCTIMPVKDQDGKPIIPGQCMEVMAADYCRSIGGVIGSSSKCFEQPDVFVSRYDKTPAQAANETKATAADDTSCLRYPQPWPWVERKPNGDFSVGGGNTCGDPYLGWHPALRDKLKPFSERMNEKIIAAKYPNNTSGVFVCGRLFPFPAGQPTTIPMPFITIWSDTRDLVACEHVEGTEYGHDTPCPGGHVIPGKQGPPNDGGIWRGFSERNTVINPKYIAWIQANAPDCFESAFCNGTVLENQGSNGAGIQGVERRLAVACLARKLCANDGDYSIHTTPAISSNDFPGNVECESSLCANVSSAYDHVGSNGQVPNATNEPSWLKTGYNPKATCEKLTGVPKNGGPCTGPILSRNYYTPEDPCYGTYVLLARANSNGGYQPSTSTCWNCMVFYNMNTGGWGGGDHPMPKTPEQIMKIMEDLVARGCNIDWVKDQGCTFEIYR
jgi:hypothetical protein